MTSAPARPGRRRRLRAVAVALAVVVALVAAVAVAVGPKALARQHREQAQDAAQVTPPGLDAAKTSYVAFPGKARAGAPVVVITEDFQCILCRQANDLYGPTWLALAEAGHIHLEFRVITIFDQTYQNNGSTRAAIAAGCAATVGHFLPYRQALYDLQAARGSAPWTDDQLRGDVAVRAGLEAASLTTFQICYNNLATRDFVTGVTKKTTHNGDITGAPVITVNGKNPQTQIVGDLGHGETDWWKQLPSTQGDWMAAIAMAASS